MSNNSENHDEWNPGLTSDIPTHLFPKITLFDPSNSHVNYEQAKISAEFCGLKPYEMNSFTVKRLAVHETFIRVTSDLYVKDGPNYEDLGISLRGMTDTILQKYITPNLNKVEKEFQHLRNDILAQLNEIYENDLGSQFIKVKPKKSGFFAKLFSNENKQPERKPKSVFDTLNMWQHEIEAVDCLIKKACLTGIYKIVSSIVGQRGRLTGEKDYIIQLATNWICNHFGSEKVGEMIEPMIQQAVTQEGYRYLPSQKNPVIFNVKGASAAGKSTIRQFQKKLVDRLDVKWEDFALISPDYWRKYLIDYDAIGKDYKYGAMLTGHELEIIDKKLDRYVESKANQKNLPHLLIDRFRFDSFSLGPENQPTKYMLSRFGHTVFLFFIITPPTETVARAWKRGHSTGRYKAVDDLLFHNVEAYTGIPRMFLKWVNKEDQKVHFEFLDNSVANGDIPRTVAFGWNKRLVVRDPKIMRIFHQYRSINLKATKPEEVYLDIEDSNQDFLTECIEKISDVTFLHPHENKILGHFHDGKCTFEIGNYFSKNKLNTPTQVSIDSKDENSVIGIEPEFDFEREQKYTLGQWNSANLN